MYYITDTDRLEDPELQMVLELRYLCGKNWTEIAEAIHCSDSHVYRIHQRALDAVEMIKLRENTVIESRHRHSG